MVFWVLLSNIFERELNSLKGDACEYEKTDSINFNKKNNVDFPIKYALKRGRNNEYFFVGFKDLNKKSHEDYMLYRVEL